ncbi:hypothetical protein [Corynebacterium freiburgense]|uniref:hypothetical protein n=1 Tax=Corynebacterium freiburgense TaxID=556548 RepID=UPI00040BBC41|nr:hypothetical protein [Corynebacterium freiburgense]WJZ03957.1 hypothetical protein CFREI_13555 [Corynebacterium freiburgense]
MVTQPQYDTEPVVKAAPADLDHHSTEFLVQRIANDTENSTTHLNNLKILQRIGALTQKGENIYPTLAGLLTLGSEPQRFFPELSATIVVLPTLHFGDRGLDGKKFLASRRLNGTIQNITEAAPREIAQFLPASENQKSYEGKRRNKLLKITRQLVLQALITRSYAPQSHNSTVQIELYPNRLEIHYPGTFNPIAHHRNRTVESLLQKMQFSFELMKPCTLARELSLAEIAKPQIIQERQRARIIIDR